jgi:hypothetical protein
MKDLQSLIYYIPPVYHALFHYIKSDHCVSANKSANTNDMSNVNEELIHTDW